MKSPDWVKAIKLSGREHGSGILQKKLWRVTSDYVRIRDLYHWGTYIDTGERIPHWRMAHAGHYKSYAVCRGMFKFNILNIHAQSSTGNGWGGQEVGYKFGEELKRRYGSTALETLDKLNRESPLKFNDQDVVRQIEFIVELMKDLEEKPYYYDRVLQLKELQ